MFRYPFNKYGLNDLIWWFRYRLQKEYKYHKVLPDLKPGYYEYQDIIEKVIASERFFWLFEHLYKEYKKLTSEEEDYHIYTEEFHRIIPELKKAYLWFKKYKPRFNKRVEKQEHNLGYFWPPSNPKGLLYSNEERKLIFDKYNKLCSFVNETTTHYLEVIVKYRMFLDT